jgi:hypothetical protein
MLSTIQEGADSYQSTPITSARYSKAGGMLEPVPEDGCARVSGAGASPPRLLMAAHRNNSKRQNGFNDSSSTLDVDTARTNESAEGGGEGNSADHTATVTPRADGPSGNVAAKIVVHPLLCDGVLLPYNR